MCTGFMIRYSNMSVPCLFIWFNNSSFSTSFSWIILRLNIPFQEAEIKPEEKTWIRSTKAASPLPSLFNNTSSADSIPSSSLSSPRFLSPTINQSKSSISSIYKSTSTSTSTTKDFDQVDFSPKMVTKCVGTGTPEDVLEKQYCSTGTSSFMSATDVFKDFSSSATCTSPTPPRPMSPCLARIATAKEPKEKTLVATRKSKFPDPKELKGLSNLLQSDGFIQSEIIDLKSPFKDKVLKNKSTIWIWAQGNACQPDHIFSDFLSMMQGKMNLLRICFDCSNCM